MVLPFLSAACNVWIVGDSYVQCGKQSKGDKGDQSWCVCWCPVVWQGRHVLGSTTSLLPPMPERKKCSRCAGNPLWGQWPWTCEKRPASGCNEEGPAWPPPAVSTHEDSAVFHQPEAPLEVWAPSEDGQSTEVHQPYDGCLCLVCWWKDCAPSTQCLTSLDSFLETMFI